MSLVLAAAICTGVPLTLCSVWIGFRSVVWRTTCGRLGGWLSGPLWLSVLLLRRLSSGTMLRLCGFWRASCARLIWLRSVALS